jgi:glutathione peroxidase
MKTLALIISMMFITTASSVYEFKLKTIDGQDFSLAKYRGKKVLVVNTASKCGYTPQYAELQKLADLYKDKLVVVGFPANNFGGQEPGANTEIKTFCQKNYGVTFLILRVRLNGILRNS